MAEKPELVIKGLSQRIRRSINDTFAPSFTKKVAKMARNQIVKRTRLGFGVDKTSGNQVRLQKLSDNYKKVRAGKLQFATNKTTDQIFAFNPNKRKKKKKKKSKGASRAAKPVTPTEINDSESKKTTKKARKTKFKTKLKKLSKKAIKGASKAVTKIKKRVAGKKKKRLGRLSSKTSPSKSNLTATGGMLDSLEFKGLKNKILIEVPDTQHGPDLFKNPVELTHAQLAKIHEKGAIIRHPSGVKIEIPERRFFDLSKSEKNGIIRFVRQSILKKYKKK